MSDSAILHKPTGCLTRSAFVGILNKCRSWAMKTCSLSDPRAQPQTCDCGEYKLCGPSTVDDAEATHPRVDFD
jgi:hypothetical protein